MLKTLDYSFAKASLIYQHDTDAHLKMDYEPYLQYTQSIDNLIAIMEVPTLRLSAHLHSANRHVLFNYNGKSVGESFPSSYLVETMSRTMLATQVPSTGFQLEQVRCLRPKGSSEIEKCV